MLPPSLRRNNGITPKEQKRPLTHDLFKSFHPIRAPEKYLPKAIHQAIEAGTNTFVWSKTSFLYFKQQEDLCCKLSSPTTMVSKTMVYWEVIPCRLLCRYQGLTGTCHNHLWARDNFHVSAQHHISEVQMSNIHHQTCQSGGRTWSWSLCKCLTHV